MTKPAKIIALYLILIIGILFLFIGDISSSHRIIRSLWNLGHFILFFCIITIAQQIIVLKHFTNHKKIIFTVTASALLAIAIEYLQLLVGRDFALFDIFLSIAGALASILYSADITRVCKTSLMITIFCLALHSVVISITDTLFANRQWPILADFSTPFEYTRVTGNADLQTSYQNQQLKIIFGIEQYSGFSLRHFDTDWSAYQYLVIDFFNPGESLNVTCRIHDAKHNTNDYLYNDRFNQRFTIPSQQFILHIPLEKVLNAPEKRKMNMRQIIDFGCFTVKLPEPRILYLNSIQLLR